MPGRRDPAALAVCAEMAEWRAIVALRADIGSIALSALGNETCLADPADAENPDPSG